jgi:hypothetical protein
MQFLLRNINTRVRTAVIIALLVVVAVEGCSTAPSATRSPNASPQAGDLVASAAGGSTIDAATAPAVSADGDDESGASAGSSFAADTVGVLPPATSGSTSDRLAGEPNPTLTPGALNPAVTQATIGSTICVSGWTATIRPPESFTSSLKIKQIGQYGYADTKMADYEEDHLISLELGGAPADPRNLWPEPYTSALSDGRPTGAHTKDAFETKLKGEVCAHSITLAAAQAEIGDHWVHAYYGIALTGAASSAPTTQPTPVTTSEPSPGPTTVVASSPASIEVAFIAFTSPVARSANATVGVQTSSGASCSIKVEYKSGASHAAGLEAKSADPTGAVSWTWQIGPATTVGSWPVTVACSSGGVPASAERDIEIT